MPSLVNDAIRTSLPCTGPSIESTMTNIIKLVESSLGHRACVCYILAKISNRPLAFYKFSSQRRMIRLLVLHFEIDRRVLYPWQ